MEKVVPQDHYFRTWNFSMFANLYDRNLNHMRQHKFEDSMYADDASFSAAIVLLQGGKLKDAWEFIDLVQRKTPNSVHAWCNKGVYHLMRIPPQRGKAEEAVREMKRLLEEEEPSKTAVIEYAYWQYTMVRTDESKQEALRLFEEKLAKGEESMIEHHYLYLKVLTEESKLARDQNDEWVVEILKKILKRCEILILSDRQEFNLEAWRCLGAVQINWNYRDMLNKGSAELSSFLESADTTEFDRMACISKVLQIQKENPSLRMKSNFFVTIARIYYTTCTVWETNDLDERWSRLERTLEFAEAYLESPSSRVNTGASLSSKVLLQMWAIKCFQQHKDEVELAYRRVYGRVRQPKRDKVTNFIAEESYFKLSEQSAEMKKLLDRAEPHVDRLREDCKALFWPRYILVKLHLGKPLQEIEEAFPQPENLESDKERAILWVNKGRFMEMTGRYEEAKKNYRAVIDLHNQSAPHPRFNWMARQGLSRVTYNNMD